MNSRELKLQALADARRRANLNVRTTSNSSTENTQSEITESPPAVYQVPNVNVPENLEEAAKLIQSELQKISQSQSVLLTLWEKLKSQAATATGVEFTKPVVFDEGVKIYGVPVFGSETVNNEIVDDVAWNEASGIYNKWFDTGHSSTSLVIQFFQSVTSSTPAAQIEFLYGNGGVRYRSARDSYGFENDWSEFAMVSQIESAKREIYAELQKLNDGLIVPVVINKD
ncbi:hypothetical protein GRU93_001535 [Salmonella enterica]|nr:hypothetical protein [Salmonella enterica]